jgi:hypothetical protein
MWKLSGVSACIFLLFPSCGTNNQAPPSVTRGLSYDVSFYTGDSLHVTATIASSEGGGLEKILFPPFGADNPGLGFSGGNVHNLRVTGATLADTLAPGMWAGDTVQAITVRSTASSYTLDYDVTFPYQPHAFMRTVLPGAQGNGNWYYQGNYLFCVPDFIETKVGWWRTGIDAHVSLQVPAGKKAYGAGSGGFDALTVYELLFVQFAMTAHVSPCGAGGTEMADLSSNGVDWGFLSTVCFDLAKTDSFCAAVFPPLPEPRAVIVQDSGSGMEGLLSFYIYNWSETDYRNSVRSVTSHEALHWWVGIRTGDLDDPWWKEATASYLGFVLGGGLGMPPAAIRGQLVRDLSPNYVVTSRALSDPYVRDHLFDGDTTRNCILLVYAKGAQVNMILDGMIRRATGGASTLFSTTGRLCSRFDHAAFSRAEFKACLEEGTGLDLSDFFARYVDKPSVLDTAVLAQTFSWLDSAGAFSGNP